MIGFPRMFCQFDAHNGPQEVSKDTCGHFQYGCVPWTCELDPQKKVFQPNLGRKKVLCVMIGFPRMFCQFDAHKGTQEVSKEGTSNMFLCLGHVNLTNRKSFQPNLRKNKKSLPHD